MGYYYGQGVEASLEQSINWFEKATEQEHSIVYLFKNKDFEDFKQLILNSEMLYSQFIGEGTKWNLGRRWSDELDNYIEFYDNDSLGVTCNTSIPWSEGRHFAIEKGMFYIYDDWDDKKEVWQFNIISMDEIEVYCYVDKKTYSLKREE